MRIFDRKGSRRLTIGIAVVAATFGLVTPTPANAENEGVPFAGRLAGRAAFTSPGIVAFHGGGQATYLGQLVSDGVAILDPPTGDCAGGVPGIPNVHTETLTAANGDELVIRMMNFACPTGPFTFHGTGHWTVPSGTGRFEGVTGEGTIDGNSDFGTGTFALTLTGTLKFDLPG